MNRILKHCMVNASSFDLVHLVTCNANYLKVMGRTQVSQTFPYLFYLFGLTTFNPFTRQITNSCNTIPALILATVIVIATIATFIAQYIEHSLQSLVIINVAAVSFVLIECTTCFAIIYKTFAPREHTQQLWHQLKAIENVYKFKFNENVDFKCFHRKYCCEIGAMLCIHLVHIMVNIAFNYCVWDIVVKLMTLTLFTVALINTFQILFYVRLLLHFMRVFNERFSAFEIDSKQSEIFRLGAWQTIMLIEHFKYIKKVHYLLWDISVLVNQHFGSIIILLFLQNSFDSVHAVYWFVWYLDRHEEWAKTKLLCKY